MSDLEVVTAYEAELIDDRGDEHRATVVRRAQDPETTWECDARDSAGVHGD